MSYAHGVHFSSGIIWRTNSPDLAFKMFYKDFFYLLIMTWGMKFFLINFWRKEIRCSTNCSWFSLLKDQLVFGVFFDKAILDLISTFINRVLTHLPSTNFQTILCFLLLNFFSFLNPTYSPSQFSKFLSLHFLILVPISSWTLKTSENIYIYIYKCLQLFWASFWNKNTFYFP